MPSPNPLLPPTETAEELGVTTDRLKAWRHEGKGPAYVKVGKFVRYPRAALDAWLAENTVTPGQAA